MKKKEKPTTVVEAPPRRVVRGTSVSKDISVAVKTIKAAILRSRYMAARKANFEHLKLYFHVGAYVSANSRNRTWETGAIAAISERLSLELPGLRGFSPSNIKNMRQFFEEWCAEPNRQLATGDWDENPSIGLILCHSMDRPVVELAVRRYAMPLGVATYRTSEDVPPAYKALKPLLDGSQKLLAEMRHNDSVPPRKTRKGRAK